MACEYVLTGGRSWPVRVRQVAPGLWEARQPQLGLSVEGESAVEALSSLGDAVTAFEAHAVEQAARRAKLERVSA